MQGKINKSNLGQNDIIEGKNDKGLDRYKWNNGFWYFWDES